MEEQIQSTGGLAASLFRSMRNAALLVFFLASSAQSQPLNLSDLPLNLLNEAASNLVVTLDDSGSMSSAYLPDNISRHFRTNYYRSPHFNKIFYDPAITYRPPGTPTGGSEPDAVFSAAIRGYYNRPPAGLRVTRDLNSEFVAFLSQSTRQRFNELVGPSWIGFGCPAALCTRQAANYFEFHGSSATNAGCTGTADQQRQNEDCYRKVVVTDPGNYSGAGGVNRHGRSMAEEKTNFANWYQYYATRADAAKTAMLRAFVPDNVPDSVRLGRQTINQSASSDPIRSGDPRAEHNTVTPLTVANRQGFYNWVRNVDTGGGTPLRRSVVRAGEYFKSDSAYRVDSLDNSSDLVGCRVNSHILVTDGFYNDRRFQMPTGVNLDQSRLNLPDGTAYPPGGNRGVIYRNPRDSVSLADLAFHYWSSDLRPDLPNQLRPFQSEAPGVNGNDYWHPKNDPATWQHMNSFAISFGADGRVPTDDATFQRLLNGQVQWPETRRGTASTVDDLYHSAINGRGDFFNASNPEQLVDALKAITERLGERTGSAPAIAATSGRINSDTQVYIASFDIESWTGDLQAFNISDGSGNGTCNQQPIGTRCSTSPLWSAADRNAASAQHLAHNSRIIFSYDPVGGAVGRRGIEFRWPALSTAQKALLDINEVNYLRGDSSLEQPVGSFRERIAPSGGAVNRVGPILHSNPVYVGPGTSERQFRFPDDLEARPYTIASRPPLVYVGGNDGMLHAYHAEGGNRGREAFAYVPNTIISKLRELVQPNFRSAAFVDGQLDYQDAYVGGQWRSLLAGGLRKGGQGYFMLDITDPPEGNSIDPNDTVMWEFSDADDADLGYTYGKPSIVKSNYNGGEWVVLLPSGYNSTESDGNVGSGEAFLYVLAADDGQVIAKIGTGSGSGFQPNGLSAPTAVSDSDVQHFGNGSRGTDIDAWTADYAYAGDLQGQLWKFDLSSTNPANWNAVLLFDAGSSQPITAAPSVGSLPVTGTAPNRESRYVYIGTGQFLQPSDIGDKSSQRMYAIIDDDQCSATPCVSSRQLLQQNISSAGALSSQPFSLQSHRGCQLNLANQSSGERVIHKVSVIDDNLVFTSLTPDGGACEATVDAALYAIDRFSCGQTAGQVLDTNNDGVIDAADQISSSTIDSRMEIKGEVAIIASGGGGDKGAALTAEGAVGVDSGGRTGRVRWRQIK